MLFLDEEVETEDDEETEELVEAVDIDCVRG